MEVVVNIFKAVYFDVLVYEVLAVVLDEVNVLVLNLGI